MDEQDATIWALKQEQGKLPGRYQRPKLWETADNAQALDWIGPEDRFGVTKDIQVRVCMFGLTGMSLLHVTVLLVQVWQKAEVVRMSCQQHLHCQDLRGSIREQAGMTLFLHSLAGVSRAACRCIHKLHPGRYV